MSRTETRGFGPGVRVVRGTPDELELAALVAGLAATVVEVVEVTEEAPPAAASAWSDRARQLGLAPAPGADAWRWSLRA